MEEYTIGDEIINNYFYRVYKKNDNTCLLFDKDEISYFNAYNKSDNELYTIKIVSKKEIKYNSKFNKLLTIKSPRLLNFVELIETDEKRYFIFKEDLRNYVSLYDFIMTYSKSSSFTREIKEFIFFEIFKAIVTLHLNEISDLDLTPDNIYIDKTTMRVKVLGNLYDYLDTVKMNNFSDAYIYRFRDPLYHTRHRAFVGEKYDVYAPDIWSIGNIFYVLLTDHYPYPNGSSEYRPNILKVFDEDPDTKQLFSNMLQLTDTKRHSIYELINSKWMQKKNFSETIKKMISLHRFTKKNTGNIEFLSFISGEEKIKDLNLQGKILFTHIIKGTDRKTFFEAVFGDGGTIDCASFIMSHKNKTYTFDKVNYFEKTYIIKKNIHDQSDLNIFSIEMVPKDYALMEREYFKKLAMRGEKTDYAINEFFKTRQDKEKAIEKYGHIEAKDRKFLLFKLVIGESLVDIKNFEEFVNLALVTNPKVINSIL